MRTECSRFSCDPIIDAEIGGPLENSESSFLIGYNEHLRCSYFFHFCPKGDEAKYLYVYNESYYTSTSFQEIADMSFSRVQGKVLRTVPFIIYVIIRQQKKTNLRICEKNRTVNRHR